MKRRALLGTLLAGPLLSACVGARLPPTKLPPSALNRTGSYVVVTVEQAPVPLDAGVGSTPQGPSATSGYGASARSRRIITTLSREYGIKAVSAWPIEPLHVECVVFYTDQSDARALIARMEHDPNVRLVQPLNEFHTLTDSTVHRTDPYRVLQRNLDTLGLSPDHPLATGKGIRIAVIDTGVSWNHPDLHGAIVAHRDLVGEGRRAFVRDVHGTEIAGVIGARANNGIGIAGVAPESSLIALKACWQRPGLAHALCNTFTLAKALVAAVELRAQVVNLSLAGPPDPLLGELLRWVESNGIAVVGAVGRNGTMRGFPTDVDGVIAADRADAGARTSGVIYAPGDQILTLEPGGHYDFASGSSLAAAEVSGVVALMIERGIRDPKTVRTILLAAQASAPRTRVALARTALHLVMGRGEAFALRKAH